MQLQIILAFITIILIGAKHTVASSDTPTIQLLEETYFASVQTPTPAQDPVGLSITPLPTQTVTQESAKSNSQDVVEIQKTEIGQEQKYEKEENIENETSTTSYTPKTETKDTTLTPIPTRTLAPDLVITPLQTTENVIKKTPPPIRECLDSSDEYPCPDRRI